MKTLEKKLKTPKRKIINIGLIFIILCTITWLGVEEYKEKRIQEKEQIESYQAQLLNIRKNTKNETEIDKTNEDTQVNEEIENVPLTQDKQYPKEEITKTYKGYDVCAKLYIPEISLETYVLDKYSTQTLNTSVTRFWGANPNKVGNFCIAGHNFRNKNMFRNLKNLKIGDTIFLSDNQVGKVEYAIYNIYKVLPEDVSCLQQETNGKKEITLITCTNDSKQRIIIKAREI